MTHTWDAITFIILGTAFGSALMGNTTVAVIGALIVLIDNAINKEV